MHHAMLRTYTRTLLVRTHFKLKCTDSVRLDRGSRNGERGEKRTADDAAGRTIDVAADDNKHVESTTRPAPSAAETFAEVSSFRHS